MSDRPIWDPRPPSPPSTSRPFPTRLNSHISSLPEIPHPPGTSSHSSVHPSAISLALPALITASPPQSPTQSQMSSQPISIPPPAGLVSPPTPAPSPGPPRRWAFEREYEGLEEGVRDMWVSGQGAGHKEGVKGKAKEVDMGELLAPVQPHHLISHFQAFSASQRFAFLSSLVSELRLNEALVVSRRIEPLLKRDFLRELPAELALYCLSFVDEARTLGRASQVSRFWNQLMQDQNIWKDMCERHRIIPAPSWTSHTTSRGSIAPASAFESTLSNPPGPARHLESLEARGVSIRSPPGGGRKRLGGKNGVTPKSPGIPRGLEERSFKQQFKHAYQTQNNWLHGGRILACFASGDDGVVTSLAMDEHHIVIAMANSHIHIFDAPTGNYRRSLIGHEAGVWALVLVSPAPRKAGGLDDPTTAASASSGRLQHRDDGLHRRASFNGTAEVFGATSNGGWVGTGGVSRPNTALGFTGPGIKKPRAVKREKQSDPAGAARGWGIKRPLVVSGGCDRVLRIWDLDSGVCVHALEGHASTIRCLKVLDGRPIAVTGSRDWSLRVWDINRGELVHTLVGHEHSVRCIEVAGNMVVSGSYDRTARVWDVDTGECIHVLRGHYHQIYACAFDGLRIVTGSLDASVRIWSAATGDCIALLQGHTSLVGQLQLIGDTLVTGGSDGRVICFDLSTLECRHRICAHDNSVTCLQQDDRWIVSGGNDGRVKLFSVETGQFVRELTAPCDAVWRVAARDDRVVILCQRGGRTVMEVLTFRPGEVGGRPLALHAAE